jgi:hypothetical protein
LQRIDVRMSLSAFETKADLTFFSRARLKDITGNQECADKYDSTNPNFLKK